MDNVEARRIVSQLIDFVKEHGFKEFEDTLYSLLDAISEEIEEESRNT